MDLNPVLTPLPIPPFMAPRSPNNNSIIIMMIIIITIIVIISIINKSIDIYYTHVGTQKFIIHGVQQSYTFGDID